MPRNAPGSEGCSCGGVVTWVRPCFQCNRNFCGGSATYVDACNACGELVCEDCIRDHSDKCRKSLKLPRRSPPGVGSAMPPWLERIRDGLVCEQCNAMRDLGSHSCEVCRQSQCLNSSCESELRTCQCGCGRDICGKCSTEIDGFSPSGTPMRLRVCEAGLGVTTRYERHSLHEH